MTLRPLALLSPLTGAPLPVLARADTEGRVSAEWDESKHPRQPGRDEKGGEFAPAPGLSAVRKMGATEINRRLDKLDVKDTELNDALLAAGVNEGYQEILKRADNFGKRARELFGLRWALRNEIEARYGPGAPHRLPKGFGPIKDRQFSTAHRPLYVSRPSVSAEEIITWAKQQGFATTLPAEDMHVTVCYSKRPVDWAAFAEWNEADHPRHPAGDDKGGEFAPKKLGAEDEFLVKDVSGYKMPEIHHDTLRGHNAWGSSHGISSMIAGESATFMGIQGYRVDRFKDNRAINQKSAFAMLEKIHGDKLGSEEKLYHSFENTRKVNWKAGDNFRIPLTASAGEVGVYGLRSDVADQRGKPTVLVFPTGTQMVAYGKWKPAEAKEFGHVYTEAIVAGGFRVKEVKRAIDPYRWQHDRKTASAHHPEWDVVYVEQVETFNPSTGKWAKR